MRQSAVRLEPQTVQPPGAENDEPVFGPYTFSPSLVTLAAPLTKGAEAIRALRTHVLAQHIQAGRRALAICGASADVGCTFVAANLAVALAQAGIKTLLVDGDMRSPMVDRLIKPTGLPPGLAACLASPGSSVGEFIETEVYPNLSVFYAGQAVANAQELLARDWFEDVMNFCLRDYEATIIDTPPANTCADARRISNVAGYSLLVARRNRSLVGDVKTLAEQLIDDHVKVVGTLLNAD